MGFGARLREERKRLGFKQAEFAALVGTDVPKQSLCENGHRELRAAYLSRLPAVGVDVLYVLTGRRSEGWLDEDAAGFLSAYLALPPELKEPIERLLANLGRPGQPSAVPRRADRLAGRRRSFDLLDPRAGRVGAAGAGQDAGMPARRRRAI